MRDARNYVIGLLSVITLASSYWAWQQTKELRELQSMQTAGLPIGEAQRQSSQNVRDTNPAGNITHDSEEPDNPETPSGETGHQTFARIKANQDRMVKLMTDPEFVRLLSVQHRAALDTRYAALFKQLGLSPAQIEQFKTLLVEKQSASEDVFNVGRAQGMDFKAERHTLLDLVAATRREVDAAILQTFGQAAYRTYQEYEQTIPYRNAVDTLETRLSYSPSPLTDAQYNQMLRILSDTASERDKQYAARYLTNGNLRPSDNRIRLTDATLNRAQGILTPDQQSALFALQEEQQSAQKMRQLINDRSKPPQPETTK